MSYLFILAMIGAALAGRFVEIARESKRAGQADEDFNYLTFMVDFITGGASALAFGFLLWSILENADTQIVAVAATIYIAQKDTGQIDRELGNILSEASGGKAGEKSE